MLYAMKVINKGHIVDKDKVESTICERKILSMLNHPYIITLHWAFTSVSLHQNFNHN
jgi:serine/threonine protein kinase